MSNELKPLPESSQSDAPFTFEVPNILLKLESQKAEIRFGGSVQLTLTTRIEYSEIEVTPEPLFRIRGTNLLSFRGSEGIPVINDAIESGPRLLPATSPTATEYLALIGKPVLQFFLCEPDINASELLKRPVWRVARSTFILP